MTQLCRASPRSPRPRPGASSGPVMNPSSDTVMSATSFPMIYPSRSRQAVARSDRIGSGNSSQEPAPAWPWSHVILRSAVLGDGTTVGLREDSTRPAGGPLCQTPHRRLTRLAGVHGSGVRSSDLANWYTLPARTRSLVSQAAEIGSELGRARGRLRPVHTPGPRWHLRSSPGLPHLQSYGRRR
jgi:hypothetical protein